MRKNILLLNLFFITSCCCFSQNFLESFVSSTTMNTPITVNQFFIDMGYSTPLFSEVSNFQGVRTEFPGFFNYYVYYEAPKEYVISIVNAMPSQDIEYADVDKECHLLLSPPDSEIFFPTVDDLSNVKFWKPETIIEKEYYSCLKFPWSHKILFDKGSNAVYHVVNEIID